MKLWIIYKEGNGFLKIIAEILQDYLEDYIDVSVGKVNKIDPDIILEERIDYLIIGDIISETIPSMEIQNWVLKYGEISKKNNFYLKALSGFYISLTEITTKALWVDFLKKNVNTEMCHPPILQLKLNNLDLPKVNGTFELVKDYSNDFIEFLLNYKKNDKKEII